MTFRDLFSERASLYSKYRPDYPRELFAWVAGMVDKHDIVWDCATGSGQAARGLADFFERVIATDASPQQIGQAAPNAAIEYGVATASESGLADGSVNMVTVAQAMHWLDLEAFYTEVRRVTAPGGALVIWGYGDPIMETDQLEAIVRAYNRGTIEKYWMPERTTLLNGYADIPFPFREIATPVFNLGCRWTLPELAGYMRTWSATANYVKQRGSDPVTAVETALAEHWGGNDNRRLVRWPLYVRAGYTN